MNGGGQNKMEMEGTSWFGLARRLSKKIKGGFGKEEWIHIGGGKWDHMECFHVQNLQN